MFNKYVCGINSIDGFLDIAEAELLYSKALVLPAGHIVEIGTWHGKSTAALAFGVRDNPNTHRPFVFAVDPHTGSPECHKMFGTTELWTFPNFWRNILTLELSDYIVPIIGRSETVAPIFKEDISLLFVDGAHDEPSVIKDLALWTPKVILGGWLIMHDVYNSLPIERAMTNFLKANLGFVYKDRCKSIAVIRREA